MTTPDSPEGLTVEELARMKEFARAGQALADRPTLALITQVERLTEERDEARSDFALEHMSRIELEARADTLAAENERLSKAIRDYLDGNYDSPRSHRPDGCAHGLGYHEACENCVDAHFEAALAAGEPAR